MVKAPALAVSSGSFTWLKQYAVSARRLGGLAVWERFHMGHCPRAAFLYQGLRRELIFLPFWSSTSHPHSFVPGPILVSQPGHLAVPLPSLSPQKRLCPFKGSCFGPVRCPRVDLSSSSSCGWIGPVSELLRVFTGEGREDRMRSSVLRWTGIQVILPGPCLASLRLSCQQVHLLCISL